MLRYAVSVAILAVGLIGWLSLGAPGIGGPGLLDPQPADFTVLEACGPDAQCRTAFREGVEAQQPTPVSLDSRVREVLFGDPTIQSIIADGTEGVDYWVDIFPTIDPGHGDQPSERASVTMVFARPVSWDGQVNLASQPCAGKSVDGRIDPDNPCLLVKREFSQVFRSFSDVQVISASIYAQQGLVTDILGSNRDPEILQKIIEEMANR